MKRLLIVTILLLFAGISFGQTASTPVDMEAEKAALNALLDKFEEGFKNGDPSSFLSSLAEDALICGTDPSEFWTKEQYIEWSEPQSSATVPELKIIDDRVIKVAPDGNSAIVVTQFIIEWSPKIPWRTAYHFIKTNEGWKTYFANIAFVPKNEHIGTINKAIEYLQASSYGQVLQKGNLVGVHVLKVELKPGVSMDQYIEFFNKNTKPAWEKAVKDMGIFPLKAIRGEDDNEFGMIVVYKDEAARDKFYKEDGSSSEYGNEVMEKIAPVNAEAEKLGTWSSTYTDWIVL